MNFSLRLIVLLLVLWPSVSSAQLASEMSVKDTSIDDLTSSVNPLIDTHKSRWFYFSSACRPFGMVNLSPDTATKGSWKSGYLYDDETIRCFSHVHAWQMSGIAVMPTTGPCQGHLGMDTYQSKFSHDDEIVRPGYHKVHLQKYGITAELTSTCRVGLHRYTFPASDESHILFDTGALLGHGPMVTSQVTRISDTEIAGYSLMEKTGRRPKKTHVYFVARFSKPFTQFLTWSKGELKLDTEAVEGPESGASVKFSTTEGEKILVKVGISYTDVDHARQNLEAEAPGWEFDQVQVDSRKEWNQWLSRFQVTGGQKEHRIKFYTDLWHALLGRRIISDVDGSYSDMTGSEPVIRKKKKRHDSDRPYDHYNFDALWGSQWSLNVLWSMGYPEVTNDFCNTMVDMYHDGGLIPRGPSGGNYTYVMIGDPATPFFANAYNKGIRNYDIEAAYEGLRKNAFPGGIRDRAGYEHSDRAKGGGMKFYVDLGYVPEDMGGKGQHRDGAAMTLEYAYQDWCLAELAKTLGKDEDSKFFLERSKNYKNLWNAESKLIQPKMKDGSWMPDFTPTGDGFTCRGFCESNSMIYTNFVMQDIQGLMELFGGEEAYTDFLNQSFNKSIDKKFVADHGHHAQLAVDYDNQPGTGMAHLFNYSGAPWLSQKWVRQVKLLAHGDITPYGGYHGDEDQGQMGALGVLMAIGLFQVDGGASIDSIYEITTPLFDKVTVQLDDTYYKGKQFEVVAKNQSPENIYIQSAKLNGKPLDRCWITHQEFSQGGKLELVLGDQPNKEWGVSESPAKRQRARSQAKNDSKLDKPDLKEDGSAQKKSSAYDKNALTQAHVNVSHSPLGQLKDGKRKPLAYDASVPTPTRTGVKYGPNRRNILDFWQAESDTPSPLVLVIHGGGWHGGKKEDVHKFVDVATLLESGISVAAIQYRFIKHAKALTPPVKGPLYDAARALQFLRSEAKQFKIDPSRIGAAGASAGGCTSLWLAYHDDLADSQSDDPVLRESTRLTCAAVLRPQTTLDPKQMKEWIPNSKYGAHAFGIKGFDSFLAKRDSIADWISEYSPYALASADDPPVCLFFNAPPSIGKSQSDPTHSANFGIGLQRRCKKLKIGCEVIYQGMADMRYKTTNDFLIEKLNK